ncbi:MAG: histidinol-phosphate aminotransferase family protein [Nitrospirae bacterium]|nr:histidinol-phosphate aminotransferase family protein [Nitrospirota bacterium]
MRPENETILHGGYCPAEWRRLGLDPGALIDFSSNVNPFGPSPRVREALTRVPIDRHPDPEAWALREVLAGRLGVHPKNIAVGNGSSELLRLLSYAFLERGDPVLVLEPTFGEYRASAEIVGGRVIAVQASEKADFRPDLDALAERVLRERPKLAFLCNPNNPTGVYLSREQAETLVETREETLWVMDESFVSFVESGWPSVSLTERRNVAVLRSMTKDYGLAGLRLGYAVGRPEIVEALSRVKPPWSVNALAQAAGVAAIEDEEHLRRTLVLLRGEASRLKEAIARLGWRVAPSSVHFFLVEVGDGRGFRDRLARDGFWVRDGSSFGLPTHVRICARKPEENTRLLAALERMARK